MTTINIEQSKITELKEQAISDGIQKLVAGAIIVKEGKILLLRRTAGEFMEGLVELPSGTIELNEDVLSGLTREVVEETGLRVFSIDRYIDSFDYLSRSGKKTRQLNFSVQADGDIKINPSEHDSFFWTDPEGSEFETLNLSEEVKKTIRRAL